MERYLFETSEFPKITVEKIEGSLRIKGWDKNTFRIDTDLPDSAEIDQEGNTFTVNSKSSCLFRVPLESELIIENITGDLVVKSLENSLTIETVDGQVILKGVGPTLLENVNGNFSSKQIEGNLKIETANGNVMIRDVEGELILEDGKGNFNFSGISQNIDINTEGNATVTLEPEFDGAYNISVGGDMIFHLESTINANVEFVSHSESIRINTRDLKEIVSEKEYEINSDQAECKISLEAKGDIDFVEVQRQDHFGKTFNFEHLDQLGDLEDNLSSLADEITQQVTVNLDASIGSITDQINEITSNIGLNKSSVDRAKKELKIKKRELRELARAQREVAHGARKSTHRVIKQKRVLRYQTHQKEKRNVDPVSDQERELILQMLQDKKIDIAQAEVLLAAIEGQDINLPPAQPAPPAPPTPPAPPETPVEPEIPDKLKDLD